MTQHPSRNADVQPLSGAIRAAADEAKRQLDALDLGAAPEDADRIMNEMIDKASGTNATT